MVTYEICLLQFWNCYYFLQWFEKPDEKLQKKNKYFDDIDIIFSLYLIKKEKLYKVKKSVG